MFSVTGAGKVSLGSADLLTFTIRLLCKLHFAARTLIEWCAERTGNQPCPICRSPAP